jgi:hypothetical protein
VSGSSLPNNGARQMGTLKVHSSHFRMMLRAILSLTLHIMASLFFSKAQLLIQYFTLREGRKGKQFPALTGGKYVYQNYETD